MRAASVGVVVAGVVALVWAATPVRWDGLVEAGAAGPVSGMAFLALLFGTLAGVVAGLIGRRRAKAGRPAGRAPVIALLVVSVIAWWPFSLFVARFSPSDHQAFGSSRVLETCTAWLAYVLVASMLYELISGRSATARGGSPDRLGSTAGEDPR